jgi:sortase A
MSAEPMPSPGPSPRPRPSPLGLVAALLGLVALSLLLVQRLRAPAVPPAPPTITPAHTPPTVVLPAAPASPLLPASPTAPAPSIARLVIPALGLDVPVVEVAGHLEELQGQPLAVWDTVAGAVGHHRGTASPGTRGNCVLSGHSGPSAGAVLARLWELRPGDSLRLITADGAVHTYTVRQVLKLPELGQSLEQRLANAVHMAPTEDARLTLITCWPDWAYTHRIVVIAALS